ncbi:MAG: hypothetical protein CSA62_00965 [Planctomycetota bacterium]|nr:MAG: hypothetical protein CSA62_00965 [Planctomycetota bacterium]
MIESSGEGSGGPGNPGGGTRGGGTGTAVVNELFVHNESDTVRNETLEVSVPFALGQQANLDQVGLSGLGTAWRVLQRWQDGSVKVAQAQFTDQLPASSKKSYKVVKGVQALKGDFQQHDWVASNWRNFDVRVRVTDDYNVSYEAGLADGTPETLHETFLVRERRWRLYLRNANPSAGIGRDFLAARVYIKEYRDTPFLKIEVVVGNDYLGEDHPAASSDPNLYPLGPVSFKKLDLLLGRGYVRMRDYLRQGSPARGMEAGRDRFTVLGPDWFHDGQTKVWRFDVYCENPAGEASAKAKWLEHWKEMEKRPLRPLATQESWLSTKALGVYGGPLKGPVDAYDRCEKRLASWRGTNWFGPWGSWGDSKSSNTTGTPRNAPLSMAGGWAVMGENPRLLEMLEGMAFQQACRTYHMWKLEVGDRDGRYFWAGVPFEKNGRKLSKENHGRYTMWQHDPYADYRKGVDWGWGATGHGWNAYDAEHFSTDLLFDLYTLTGDSWALDEMKMLGQCLKAMMRLQEFFTSNIVSARAEGWCMQSFLQCWLATGDDDYKNYALKRVEEVIAPQRQWKHASRAMFFQFNHPLTGYPNPTGFFMPWQHGPVALSFHAASKYWGSESCRRIAEDVVTSVQYGWVLNYKNDPKWGTIANGLRYYVPVEHQGKPVGPDFFDNSLGIKWGDSPLGGAHEFLISGLYMVAQDCKDSATRAKAIYCADKLLGQVDSSRSRLWSKWCFAIPERMLP